MLSGLMQNRPLQISNILDYAARAHSGREIVSQLLNEPTFRYDYAGLARRVAQLAHALDRLGVGKGEMVSSLAWNTHRHLELFYGVSGIGAVLHTANPRLSDEQLSFTINHAGSSILFFDSNQLPVVERIAPLLESVRMFVMMVPVEGLGENALDTLSYEALIADEPDSYDWPVFDEGSAAFLCYTSGTTGDPKGVLYSHRAIVLHAMGAGLNAAFGFTAFDVVMPCSSLYHATAWGLPFTAPICGAKLVLPADKMGGKNLHELIEAEGVTFTGGVPTIWTMYLAHLEQTGQTPTTLKRIMIGGSAVPRAMAEKLKARYNVDTLQLWGMTETCPLGVIASSTPALAQAGTEEMQEILWTRQGRLQFGIELKIVDESGKELAWDGLTAGALKVRGPWVVDQYYQAGHSALDQDGWFDTGDIATIDANGFMRITDRTKDVIKSGGEWISSIDLENAAIACPGVRFAAVVGIAHPKWEERPLLVIEPNDGATLSKADLLDFLSSRVARWWLPDDVIFQVVPLTATGKIDKKVLKDAFRHHYTSANGI